MNIRTYDDIINLLSYSATHMPYFKNLQQRIKYEENAKEEFNLEDFRSTYGLLGRFGNTDF